MSRALRSIRRFLGMALWVAVVAGPSGCAVVPDRGAQCAAGPPVVPVAQWDTQAQGIESIRFEHDATQVQLLFVWRHQPPTFALRGLNPLGIEVFRVDVDAQGTRWQAFAATDIPLDAGRLLADFQLVHWPINVLQAAYRNTPWTVKNTHEKRELSCFGVSVATVDSQANSRDGFILSNIPGEYRLHGQVLGGQ